jgi:hypothetical protein
MKINRLIALYLLMATLGFIFSCKKDIGSSANKQTHSTLTNDTISYVLFSPAYTLAPCRVQDSIDIDADGIPDISCWLYCQSGVIYDANGFPTGYDNLYNWELRSILNPRITFPRDPRCTSCAVKSFVINSPISSLDSFKNWGGIIAHYNCTGSDAQNSGCHSDTSIQYIGYREADSLGYKYGWFACHFDASFNIMLDGMAINNKRDSAILAGQIR